MYDNLDVVKIFLPPKAEIINIDASNKLMRDTEDEKQPKIKAKYKYGEEVYIIVLMYYINGWCLVERKKENTRDEMEQTCSRNLFNSEYSHSEKQNNARYYYNRVEFDDDYKNRI